VWYRTLRSQITRLSVDTRYRIQTCDSCLSRYATDDSLINQILTSKVDVYTCGIILCKLATGVIPYQGTNASTIVLHVQQYEIRLAIPADITRGICDLII
jgi:serine/threonine protein kinase